MNSAPDAEDGRKGISRVMLRCKDDSVVEPGSAAAGGDPFCFVETMTFFILFFFVSPPLRRLPFLVFWCFLLQRGPTRSGIG